MPKKAEIKIYVELDDTNMPQKMQWEATDSGVPGLSETEAVMISLWDKQQDNTLSLDLWTNDFLISKMNAHYYHTFLKMADTFEKATSDSETSQMIRTFAEEFAKKLNLLKKDEKDGK